MTDYSLILLYKYEILTHTNTYCVHKLLSFIRSAKKICLISLFLLGLKQIKELPLGKSENDAVPFPRTSTRRNRGRRTEATSN